MIYHLAPGDVFRRQLREDVYRPTDLDKVGFVHCAGKDSVLSVANDYFASTPAPLLMLTIDPERLTAETRYEAAIPLEHGGREHLKGNPSFPHVYGPDRSLRHRRR